MPNGMASGSGVGEGSSAELLHQYAHWFPSKPEMFRSAYRQIETFRFGIPYLFH
jgi:hypothetical protein